MYKFSPPLLKQLWLTLGASLAFMIIGLVRGYSSSALPSIERLDPYLIGSDEQKSWIGSIPPLGAFTGSILSGPLMARWGRKRALQLAAPLWGAAWLVVGFARSLPLLLAARMMCGFCVGASLAPAQVYVSESCDPAIRGRLGSLPSLAMSLGVLVSYVAGGWLPWRALAFFSAAFCGLLFAVLWPLPESPAWLASRGATDQAAAATAWLHLSKAATATVNGDKDKKPGEEQEAAPSLWSWSVLTSPGVRRPLVVGLALLLFQQLSGVDAVIFFTVEIFQNAGSSLEARAATMVVGLVQLCANAAGAALADAAGRRALLLISAAIMAAAMAAMGCCFYFHFDNESWLGYLPIVSLVVFMVGFALGFGGLPFLLLGELFPARHREPLAAAAAAFNLLAMFAVIKSYHALDHLLTAAGTFWMYACCCGAAFLFVLLAVPETRGKSLADIERHFQRTAGEKKAPSPPNKQETIQIATL